MGCSLSCSSSQPFEFNGVRVIHINGYVEDFAGPVTAGQVTGKLAKHVLCTSAHLLSLTTLPFRPDDLLEPGRLYFLLPFSVFQSDSSPVDLASLMARLTANARRGKPTPAGGPRPVDGFEKLGLGNDGPLRSRARVWTPELDPRSRARAWTPELDPIEERSLGGSMGSQRSLGGSMGSRRSLGGSTGRDS